MPRTILFLLFSCLLSFGAETMWVKSDERLIFYPAIAQRVPGKDEWRVQLTGSLFEPQKWNFTLAAVRAALNLEDVELSAAEQKIFKERARLFLVDHERGRSVIARFGAESFKLGKSRADGVFSGEATISDKVMSGLLVTTNGGAQTAAFQAALPPVEKRAVVGEVFLLEDAGLSVISDIDDTIKVTQVWDRNKMLRNTFVRDFDPVPGMAKLYQRLARERGAQFHYVSASPWQLYEPLAAFIHDNGFPAGTFSLKTFRWKNHTALSLFANPEKYKPTVVEPLLKQFPKRSFILIGDSGERDPEVYAALARKYPKQIERIYIRNVTGEAASAERYQKVFVGLPSELWQIFTRPEEIALDSRFR